MSVDLYLWIATAAYVAVMLVFVTIPSFKRERRDRTQWNDNCYRRSDGGGGWGGGGDGGGGDAGGGGDCGGGGGGD